jgi:hypothetical protein
VVAHGWFSRRIEVLTSRLEVLLARVARVLESAPASSSAPNLPRVPEKP